MENKTRMSGIRWFVIAFGAAGLFVMYLRHQRVETEHAIALRSLTKEVTNLRDAISRVHAHNIRSENTLRHETLAQRAQFNGKRFYEASNQEVRADSPSPGESVGAASISSKPFNDLAISHVAQFVSINEVQRERLGRMFQAQRELTQKELSTEERERAMASIESLEDILGKELATTYREKSLEAAQNWRKEAREKEILLVSRKLGLSDQQETLVRAATDELEEEFKNRANSTLSGNSPSRQGPNPSSTMEERKAVLAEKLKGILTEAQYNTYLEFQASRFIPPRVAIPLADK